jgi:hypothetical protein
MSHVPTFVNHLVSGENCLERMSNGNRFFRVKKKSEEETELWLAHRRAGEKGQVY